MFLLLLEEDLGFAQARLTCSVAVAPFAVATVLVEELAEEDVEAGVLAVATAVVDDPG